MENDPLLTPEPSGLQKQTLLRLTTRFYLGTALVALLLNRLLLGAFFPVPLALSWQAAGQTVMATGALIACVGLLIHLDFAFMRRIHQKLAGFKVLIVSLTPAERIYISLWAGLAEELLFRGLLQQLWGVTAASLIFGLLHALTFGYFLLATAMGFFLGGLLHSTGNLLVPVAVHALYDIFALSLLARMYRRQDDIQGRSIF